MDQHIGFCTTSDGVTIAYATVGEGPPVVYTTGWPTHLEMEWDEASSRSALEYLAQGSRLVRYDMRGSGISDREVTDLSLDALTRDVTAVVDHLKLERFALVSLGSLGGPVAMAFAAAQPERVTRLVLSTAFVRGDQITTADRQRAMIDYAEQFGVPTSEFMDQPDADLQAQREAQRRQHAAASPKTQAALLRTLFSVDMSEALPRLTMPTLILHGRTDRIVPFALGRELVAQLPHAEFIPIQGISTAWWAQRGVIVPALRRFLELEVPVQEPRATPSSGPLTILFTDVEGSTALTRQFGDAKARDVLRTHERIVRDALKGHGGTEVKTMGDGFMASFSSATRALECAVAMQRAIAEWNVGVGAALAPPQSTASRAPTEPIRVRIGLNAGEPIAEDEDLFGTAVIVASRIAAHAEGGEIVVSDVVRQLVAGRGFLFADRGDAVLRGFEDPVRLFAVRWQGQ